MTSEITPLTLEDAQSRLLGLRGPLTVEWREVADAVGRYLAEPLVARRTQPAADMSAMDGYAVVPGDLAGPWTVVGESAAGRPYPGALAAGEAVRISTGALMPADAGAVIVQEDVRRAHDRATLIGDPPSPPDRHLRPRGLDFREGGGLLAQGTWFGPAQAALAVAAGHARVPVRVAPTVAVLDSGDELRAPGDAAEAHQLPASNGLMLAAMIGTLAATVRRIGPVPDDRERLASAIASADDADVIVTSGGASVGDHDLIRPALAACGASTAFWRVAIKPGKPLLVATRERAGGRGPQVIVGLPGNPVSSYVTAHLFVLPLLRSLLGARAPLPMTIRAGLAAPLSPGGSRREFLRARWDGASVVPQTSQDSGALGSLATSNALIDRAGGAPAAAIGETIAIYPLENGGGGR